MVITTSWKEEGLKEGIEQGRKQGIEQGRKLELIESILEIIKFKSIDLSDVLKEEIKALNISQLKELRKLALQSNNIEEIQRGLDDIES